MAERPAPARSRAGGPAPTKAAPGAVPPRARLSAAPPDLGGLLPKVVALGEKYGYDAAHGQQVARLCEALFAALAPVHGLQEAWAVPLQHAALLHDVGYFLGAQGHHRHSAYLIRHDALLVDYPPEWRRLVALLARNHRRRVRRGPRSWGRSRRRVAVALAALLRLADGLDYGHDGAARLAAVRVRAGRLQIGVAGLRLRTVEPVLRKKALLFARTFSLPVVFTAAEH